MYGQFLIRPYVGATQQPTNVTTVW